MSLRGLRVLRGFLFVCFVAALPAYAQEPPPELTRPVNDFAGVIDGENERAIEALIRSLQQASGDVVVVAAVDTFAPYADIQEYAVRMFENRGRGVGQRGRDNGLLVVLAVKDRRVHVEVGYELEQFITDGFAGEASRRDMAPEFKQGHYGRGLLAGVTRIVERIAEGRNVTLQGVRTTPPRRRQARASGTGRNLLVALLVLVFVINGIAARIRGRRGWNRWGGPWGGWHSGVGPFGGGFGGMRGGGFGGGGFGGGFGGFGGGRSGGGGGGASW